MAFFLYPHSRTATQTTQTAQSLSPGPARAVVTPPSRFAAQAPSPLRWVSQAWRWLWDQEEPAPKLAPIGEIRKIRAEFHAALMDMQSAKAYQVRYQIEASRSLRELWHLRADVFEIVAENRGEGEAKARVAALNHHFPEGPARSPRESNRSAKVTTW